MEHIELTFKVFWVFHLWFLTSVQDEVAFSKRTFADFLKDQITSFSPVSPHRRSKNRPDLKHGGVKIIFLYLINDSAAESETLRAFRTVKILNESYGNDVMSSFEMATGYKDTIGTSALQAILDDVVQAQEKLYARQ